MLHGASGISDEDLIRLREFRIAKVNIGTAIRFAFIDTLKEELKKKPNLYDRTLLFQKSMEQMKETVKHKLKLLGF